MPAHVRSLPQPLPGPRAHTPTPLWEDRPLATTRMDFRQYEAEMAEQRGEATTPSPLNATPGSRVRVNAGWAASWLTNQKQMKAKFDHHWSPPPKTSYWRPLAALLEDRDEIV